MAREHLPIQIGLPPEPAWQMSEPMPISYIAFVLGDEMPDSGEAFLAAGRAFEMAPPETAEVPPTNAVFSTTKTVKPSSTARMAVMSAPAPEPTTTTSNCVSDFKAISRESIMVKIFQ